MAGQPRPRRGPSRARRGLCLLPPMLAAAPLAWGEQVAVRTYRPVDGLTTGYIAAIHQDSRGYLWVGTGDGLSRFDGRRFVRYGTREGLPSPAITSIAEDRAGGLWVASYHGGLLRLEEAGMPPFRAMAT